MADKGLEEARALDKQIQAEKKRAAKKRTSKSPAKARSKAKASAKKTTKKRAAAKRCIARAPKATVVKLAPDVEIMLKSNRYRIVQVRDERAPTPKRIPSKPTTTARKTRKKTSKQRKS